MPLPVVRASPGLVPMSLRVVLEFLYFATFSRDLVTDSPSFVTASSRVVTMRRGVVTESRDFVTTRR
jgi:hypothetical protein